MAACVRLAKKSQDKNMRYSLLIGLTLVCAPLAGCENEVIPPVSTCSPDGYTESSLLELRENKFGVQDDAARQTLALNLIQCLSDPNPQIRDGVAYEALATWMRGTQLNAETIRTLKQTLLEIVNDGKIKGVKDSSGFARPFAALILAEIARVDRTTPFMSNYDRTAFVAASADYMKSIKDYRGYNNKDGWRHNVAHGADWLMQLSLNEQLTKADFIQIRDAVQSQIRADKKHAYIHGESARLARPILFLARRGAFSQDEWTAWIEDISAPTPMSSWSAAFRSESGLAQRHNLKQFLNALYLNASLSQNDGTRQLLPGTIEALQTLP